jgi:hypothetical protein
MRNFHKNVDILYIQNMIHFKNVFHILEQVNFIVDLVTALTHNKNIYKCKFKKNDNSKNKYYIYPWASIHLKNIILP